MSASETGPDDVRPIVGRPVSNRGVWLFAGALAVGAVVLFSALEARRAEITSPATGLPAASAGDASLAGGLGSAAITAPPPLVLPDGSPGYGEMAGIPEAPKLPAFRMVGFPGQNQPMRNAPIPSAPIAPRGNYPVFMEGAPGPQVQPPAALPSPAAADDDDLPARPGGQLAGPRVGASRFQNPQTTVPQGAVIQAVLETALDSNRPGFVRAVVARDVRGFDGSRVLIPRGSRLFGEYKADLAQGQNRALVQWQRLTRPDGVQIALDSPAADPLGRAGVGGKVDSHFFQRFSGAVLQSALDIGVGVATRSASNDTVVVGLPGSAQAITAPQTETIKPTLRVRHGVAVSVFVARDLDFSSVEP